MSSRWRSHQKLNIKKTFKKMAQLINEAEIRETWSPIIEAATGITDANKLAWMSEYCHNHKLYEDASSMGHMRLDPVMNLGGMGAVALPNVAAGTKGSGDKAPTLLPLAMQVAAQTIALDLVPVIPMAGPMGLLSYLDFVYEGGKIQNSVAANGTAPTYVKSKSTDGDGSADGYTFTKLTATSRIDGFSIYKVEETADHTGTMLAAFESLTAVDNGFELVKGLEDHLPQFAGDASGNPFSREEGERTPEKVMGLSLFSKAVEAKTFQVAAAVTREQVQDLKQFGVDAVAQVEAVLVNELTQSINDLIIKNIADLGASNITKATAAGEISANSMTVELIAASQLNGGKTEGSEHRKILTGILAAANLIANRGRRGAGNFAVVGPQVATALQAVAGYVPNPFANTVSQAAGAIYPVGSIAGVQVYTNPKWKWNNYDVLVGRKGDGNGPGLVFMPYLMAESVQTIAEGTMAPKIAVKSRFALVEAGFHPETQYVKFTIAPKVVNSTSWTNLISLA
jgi:hypothetical protein